jgi:hypothetical protein
VKWLSTLSQSFAERIPIWQRRTIGGHMSAKRPVSTVDALLAATAKVHQMMMLATRNVADVADLGAKILNPFAPSR